MKDELNNSFDQSGPASPPIRLSDMLRRLLLLIIIWILLLIFSITESTYLDPFELPAAFSGELPANSKPVSIGWPRQFAYGIEDADSPNGPIVGFFSRQYSDFSLGAFLLNIGFMLVVAIPFTGVLLLLSASLQLRFTIRLVTLMTIILGINLGVQNRWVVSANLPLSTKLDVLIHSYLHYMVWMAVYSVAGFCVFPIRAVSVLMGYDNCRK
jgi:hypothetical protein